MYSEMNFQDKKVCNIEMSRSRKSFAVRIFVYLFSYSTPSLIIRRPIPPSYHSTSDNGIRWTAEDFVSRLVSPSSVICERCGNAGEEIWKCVYFDVTTDVCALTSQASVFTSTSLMSCESMSEGRGRHILSSSYRLWLIGFVIVITYFMKANHRFLSNYNKSLRTVLWILYTHHTPKVVICLQICLTWL